MGLLWKYPAIHSFASSSKICQWNNQKKSGNKEYFVTDDAFDSLRELIVEYLIKGINRAMLKSKQEGKNESSEYISFLAERGTVKGRKDHSNKINLDETDIQRISIEEDVYPFAFQRMQEEEKLDSKEFLLDDVKNLEKYVEVAVIAPNLFRMMRQFFGIDDNIVATTFSIDKLRSGDLHIKLGSGRGGSFFIYPANAKFLLKAIKVKEFEILRGILVKYFLHIVKGKRSLLNPSIGLFTVSIKGHDTIEPVYFMMMPNVLPLERALLSNDT